MPNKLTKSQEMLALLQDGPLSMQEIMSKMKIRRQYIFDENIHTLMTEGHVRYNGDDKYETVVKRKPARVYTDEQGEHLPEDVHHCQYHAMRGVWW
jgi:hypothetical protein